MQLPATTSSYQIRVRFGRYLARRLRRAKLGQLADDMTSATNALRESGRAWDDTEDATQDALADRDAADDDLDVLAQEARNTLAGRWLNAVREAPYTSLFPQGIGYYTAAPLDEEVKRYGELRQRLVEHLPEGDEVRTKAVAGIEPGLVDFQTATKLLDEARTADALARTRLAKAVDAWTVLAEKTYGTLVTERGRAAADRFFPRVTRKVKGAKGGKDSGAPDPG